MLINLFINVELMSKNELVGALCEGVDNLWGKSLGKINTFVRNLIIVLSVGKTLHFSNSVRSPKDYCCNDLKLGWLLM